MRKIILLTLITVLISFIWGQDTIPPSSRVIFPPDGSYTSCSNHHFLIYISDEPDGPASILRSSLHLTCFVSGVPYFVDWDEVSVLDTLNYFPFPVDFEDGDEVDLLLAPVQDIFGNISEDLRWSITVDLSPPYVEPLYPTPGSEISEAYPDVQVIINDTLSGENPDSSWISIDGYTIALNDPGVTIDDSLFTISLSEIGIPLPGGSSFELCIHGADSAMFCGVNFIDTCFSFSVEPGGPIASLITPPNHAAVSCPDTGIVIEIEDENGILEDSLFLIIDTDTLALGDSDLAFDGEYLTLPLIPYGEHTYEVLAMDSLYNNLETPLIFTVIVDTIPPSVITFSPDTAIPLIDLEPIINFTLTDDLAGVKHFSTYLRLEVNGVIVDPGISLSEPELSHIDEDYTLDMSLTDIDLQGGDTLSVCVIAYDSIAICDENQYVHCFDLIIPYTPPVCSLVYPEDDIVISCDSIDIKILLIDDEGIDESSISILVAGRRYTLSSENLRLNGDTLIYSPSEPWRHGMNVPIFVTMVKDILGTPVDRSYSWSFVVDLEGPVLSSTSPAPDELVLDPSRDLVFIFRDDLSGIDPNTIEISVDGTIYSYPDISLDFDDNVLTFYNSGFDEVDTVEVCYLGASDSPYPICPPNTCDDCPQCWTIYIDGREPYVTPPEGVISACDSQTTSIYIWTPIGIIDTTIVFEVNGTTYDISSPQLWFEADTLHFGPSSEWTDGDTVNCHLIAASDGLTSLDEYTWEFYIDLTPPAFTGITPLPGEILTTTTPTLEFELHDSISGLDSISFDLEVNGSHFDIGSEYFTISGSNYQFDISSAIGEICGGTPSRYCLRASDLTSIDYCGPNILDTCINFSVEVSPPIVELVYPDPDVNSSCADAIDQALIFVIDEENGIDESTILLEINDEIISTSDSRLTLRGDSLFFYPSVAFTDGEIMEFNLYAISDILCNESDEISGSILFDLTPPVFELITPTPGIVVSEVTPTIEMILYDLYSEYDFELEINGESFTFDRTSGDTGFYTPSVPFDDNDTVSICAIVWDETGPCPANTDTICTFFLIDAVAPVAYTISPDSGQVISCEEYSIFWVIEDISNIDLGSIIVDVNDVEYMISDHELRYVNDTLIYMTDSDFIHGDTIDAHIVNVTDIAGNSTENIGYITFIIDLEAPIVISSPGSGSILYDREPRISFFIEDTPAGFDDSSFVIQLFSDEYTFDDPSIFFDGDSVIFDIGLVDVSLSAGDSFCLEIHAEDLAGVCGHNMLDTTICYQIAETPPELLSIFPGEDWHISCADTLIVFAFADSEGINPDTASIVYNGTGYEISDGLTSIEENVLYFNPPESMSGHTEFCITYLEDIIGSTIDSTLCVNFFVDTEPPAYYPTPSDSDRISNPSPVIDIRFTDSTASVIDSVSISGVWYTITSDGVTINDSMFVFDPSIVGIDTLDTGWIEICIEAHDTAMICGYNELHECYNIYINLSAPGVELVMPFDSAYSACSDQNIVFILTDSDGIDTSSIALTINENTYSTSSSDLTFRNDSLIFNPGSLYSNNTVNVELTLQDILGNVVNPPYSFVFFIDTIAPVVESVVPMNGEYVSSRAPQIIISVTDFESGIDTSHGIVTIGDSLTIETDYSDTGFTVSLEDEGLRFLERDTINCVFSGYQDTPDFCSPNMGTDYPWLFIIADDDTLPPIFSNYTDFAYCNNFFHIRCEITDTSGIMTGSVFANVINGTDTFRLEMVQIGTDQYETQDSVFIDGTITYYIEAFDNDFDDEIEIDRTYGETALITISCTNYIIELLPEYTGELGDTCIGDTLYGELGFINLNPEQADIDSITLETGEYFFISDFSPDIVDSGETLIVHIGFIPDFEVVYEDSITLFANNILQPVGGHWISSMGMECISEFSALPTPFSPNGDGINDELIFLIPERGDKEIYIFDTRNTLRWESFGDEKEFHWDGIDKNGLPAPIGSYVYVVKVDDKKYKTGTITIVR